MSYKDNKKTTTNLNETSKPIGVLYLIRESQEKGTQERWNKDNPSTTQYLGMVFLLIGKIERAI